MALILCPDCSSSVSSKAKNCLKCGRPIRPKDNFAIGLVFYGVVIIFGFVLAVMFSPQIAFIPWVIAALGLIFLFIRKLL